MRKIHLYFKAIMLTFLIVGCSPEELSDQNKSAYKVPPGVNEPHVPFPGDQGGGGCSSSYSFTGDCNGSGAFSGTFVFGNNCERLTVSASHIANNYYGLSVQLPQPQSGTVGLIKNYTLNSYTWIPSSNNTIIIKLNITRSITHNYYPNNDPPSVSNIEVILTVNLCNKTIVVS